MEKKWKSETDVSCEPNTMTTRTSPKQAAFGPWPPGLLKAMNQTAKLRIVLISKEFFPLTFYGGKPPNLSICWLDLKIPTYILANI